MEGRCVPMLWGSSWASRPEPMVRQSGQTPRFFRATTTIHRKASMLEYDRVTSTWRRSSNAKWHNPRLPVCNMSRWGTAWRHSDSRVNLEPPSSKVVFPIYTLHFSHSKPHFSKFADIEQQVLLLLRIPSTRMPLPSLLGVHAPYSAPPSGGSSIQRQEAEDPVQTLWCTVA